MVEFQRQTAYKVWIADLLNGKYVRQVGEWDPNYVEVRDLKVSRVNLLASVIGSYKSDNSDYGYIELDDSTGVMKVKAWKEDVCLIENIKIGDMVLVVGRVREMNSEIYILAEIVKPIENKEWANVRKAELKKKFGETTRVEIISEKQPEAEEIIEDSTVSGRQKVLSIIEKHEEIGFDALVFESDLNKDEVDNAIKELLKEGEIYQPRAGILKIV